MKSLSLVLFLLLFLQLNSQKTIALNKQWNVVDYKVFTPNTCSKIYEFRTDTIINGTEYLQLHYNSDSLLNESWIPSNNFLREDSLNRIYILDHNNIEALLYDFNLTSDELIVIKHNWFECELKVIGVDSLQLLNGEFRKRITLIRSDDPSTTNPWYGYKYWVQGIGSMTALTNYVESCFTDYPFDLLCYFENNELLFSNPVNSSCFITPTLDFDISNNVTIYPNPTNSILNIETSSTIQELIIYNLNNEIIFSTKENSKSLAVDFLNDGLYFIEVIQGNSRIIKKLLIQK